MTDGIQLYWYEDGVLKTKLVDNNLEIDEILKELIQRKVILLNNAFQFDTSMTENDLCEPWWFIEETRGERVYWESCRTASMEVPDTYLLAQLLAYGH